MAENSGGFVKGFIVGSIFGSILALVMAPKSGREFREELGEESGKLYERAKKDFENARKAAAHTYESSRDKFIHKMTADDDEPEDPSMAIGEDLPETEEPVKTGTEEKPKKQATTKRKRTTKSK